MPTKRELLAHFTRDELKDIVSHFGLEADARSPSSLLEAVAGSKKAKLPAITKAPVDFGSSAFGSEDVTGKSLAGASNLACGAASATRGWSSFARDFGGWHRMFSFLSLVRVSCLDLVTRPRSSVAGSATAWSISCFAWHRSRDDAGLGDGFSESAR